MASLPSGFSVRGVPFRDAPDDVLAALHLVESEVERERRPDRSPKPLENYVAFARNLPSAFEGWSWLVEAPDGTPVASSTYWFREGGDPRNIRGDLFVREGRRRRGIATHLLGLILDAAEEHGRSLLMGHSCDTAPSGEAFARKLQARPGRVNRTSELLLSEVDWDMVAAWEEEGPKRAPGYRLHLIEGAYPPELYADAVVFHDIMETAPRDDVDETPSHITEGDVAEDDRWLLESGFDRWTLFVYEPVGGACVGGTNVQFGPLDPDVVFQGDTGIHPDHRGRGLGKWVKAAMLQKVRRERPDAKRVNTGNAYSNAPMLAINDALGFRVVHSATVWQIEVSAARAQVGGGREAAG